MFLSLLLACFVSPAPSGADTAAPFFTCTCDLDYITSDGAEHTSSSSMSYECTNQGVSDAQSDNNDTVATCTGADWYDCECVCDNATSCV